MDDRIANTPEPPYYAVVFSSTRRDDTGYGPVADRMLALAAAQPGYLGVEHARDPDGFGLTVSYWRSEADIAAWKRNAEHGEARTRGRRDWYAGFAVRVARVERAYAWPTAADTGQASIGSTRGALT